jgi:hypothetical protein
MWRSRRLKLTFELHDFHILIENCKSLHEPVIARILISFNVITMSDSEILGRAAIASNFRNVDCRWSITTPKCQWRSTNVDAWQTLSIKILHLLSVLDWGLDGSVEWRALKQPRWDELPLTTAF